MNQTGWTRRSRGGAELAGRLRTVGTAGGAALRTVGAAGGAALRKFFQAAKRRAVGLRKLQTARRAALESGRRRLHAEKREQRRLSRQSGLEPAFSPLPLPPPGGAALPSPAPKTAKPPIGAAIPGELLSVPLETLRLSPPGARRDFEDTALLRLADSIRLHGLLEPLLLRETGDPAAPYAILSGHRRLRALEILGRSAAPCRVLAVTEEEGARLALLCNLHRQPLTLFEQVEAEAALPGDCAASAASLSQPYEQMFARRNILRFTPKERALILAAGLPESGAVALAGITDPVTRMATLEDLCRRIGERGSRDAVASLLQASAATAKLADSRKRLLVRDLRLFYNSIDRAVAAVKETGMRVRYDVRDESDRQVIEITLLREGSE